MNSEMQYPCNKIELEQSYELLLHAYGPQGWWPILSKRNSGSYDSYGYHPSKPGTPNKEDIFEIAVGAVLTQNTAWRNVVTAMESMMAKKVLSTERISALRAEELADCIKASGYYNQKAKKVKLLASRFIRSSWDSKEPSREELLALWGIGMETADSILLYGYGKPVFVVDAYTKRLLYRLGCIRENTPYEKVRSLAESSLKLTFGEEGISRVFSEFHALIVRHGKTFCGKIPKCETCILSRKRQNGHI